jgi:hypothetical protein
LPGKLIQQLCAQAQRLLGQQSLAGKRLSIHLTDNAPSGRLHFLQDLFRESFTGNIPNLMLFSNF